MVVADHVQGVVRTNFLASWDEIGEDFEMEETFALSSMSSLEGKSIVFHSARILVT